MKFLKVAALALFALICVGRASAQFPCTTSPNVGFQIPNIGNQTNWGTCLNTDLNMLDVLLGGTSTLTVSSLTPSVAGSTNWLTANTSPVAITNFTGGFPGQSIHVLCGVGDDFTNIPGSANIVVSGAWSCATSESISFTLVGTTWIENGRAGGGSAALNIQLAGVPQGTAATINFSTNTSVSISGGVATVTASTTAATAFSALTASSNPNAGTFAASGNSWDFSATNSFLLPLIGNGALKPGASGDDIQFVSNNGNDANDGQSWGSAKLTNAAACAALPSGNSSCTAGKGVVFIAPGFTGSVLTSTAAGVQVIAAGNSFSGIPAILLASGPINFRQSGLPCGFGSPSGINWQVCVNGTDLQWEHPGAGGNGRFHVDSDFLVGPPGSATSGGNFNSFAWDNEGSYWDGTQAQNNLWEHAVSTTPATGGLINSRENIWPLFTGTCAGCTADLAIGASGVNPGQGNLPGAPMWDFIVLPRDGFTATFTHTFTGNHTFALPDLGGTIALVNAPQTFTSLMQFTAGAQSNFFSSSSTNPAASGILRCASGDPCAVWRNNANSGDIALSKDTNDNLNFNGLIVAPLASGFASGDCGEPTLISGKWTVVDAGGACGAGGSAFTGGTGASFQTVTESATPAVPPVSSIQMWAATGDYLACQNHTAANCGLLGFNTALFNSTSLSSASVPNLNNTTPAAGSGFVNATIQVSGANVSIEVPTTTLTFPLAANQPSNGADTIIFKRFQDTGTPSGFSIRGENAAATATTWSVDVNGNATFNTLVLNGQSSVVLLPSTAQPQPWFEADSCTSGANNTCPGFVQLGASPANAYFTYIAPCLKAGAACAYSAKPTADSSNSFQTHGGLNPQTAPYTTADSDEDGFTTITTSTGSADTALCPSGTAFANGWRAVYIQGGAGGMTFTKSGSCTLTGTTTTSSQFSAILLWSDGTNLHGQALGGSGSGGSGTVTSIATTSPITGGTITTSGTIACPTCVTSAAALTANAVVIGGGGQASSTISADTTTTHALFATAGAPAFRAITATDIPTLNQNTTGTAANLAGCTPSTAGSVCYWNGSAWTLLAGNASGTNFLQETSAGVPSWAAPTASVLWSGIGNPGGNLSLTMAADTSLFTYNATTGSVNLWTETDTASNTGTGFLHSIGTALSSTASGLQIFATGSSSGTFGNPVAFQNANLTAATSGQNQPSPEGELCGNIWNGASAQDCGTWQITYATGTNPAWTLKLTHSGSSGSGTVDFSAANNLTIGPTTSSTANINGVQTIFGGGSSQGSLGFRVGASGGSYSFQSSSGVTEFGITASTGAVSNIASIAAVGLGVPAERYNTAATNQTASIGGTTMVTAPAADTNYEFQAYVGQLNAGTTCTTAGSVGVNVIYTDPVTGSTYIVAMDAQLSGGVTIGTTVPLSSSTLTVGNVGSFRFSFRAKASTAVQFSTTYTAGSCATGQAYNIYPKLFQQ